MGYNPGGNRVDAPVLGITAAIEQDEWRRLARLGEFAPTAGTQSGGEADDTLHSDRPRPDKDRADKDKDRSDKDRADKDRSDKDRHDATHKRRA